jgi:uncharacterized protein YyaL (SSP411 family)
MKTITTWRALMMYAAAEGAARKSGDPERIEKAKKACDDYAALCLTADEMLLDCTYADLAKPREHRN